MVKFFEFLLEICPCYFKINADVCIPQTPLESANVCNWVPPPPLKSADVLCGRPLTRYLQLVLALGNTFIRKLEWIKSATTAESF